MKTDGAYYEEVLRYGPQPWLHVLQRVYMDLHGRHGELMMSIHHVGCSELQRLDMLVATPTPFEVNDANSTLLVIVFSLLDLLIRYWLVLVDCKLVIL